MKDFLPIRPAVDLRQIIGAHDPNEAHPREKRGQVAQGLRRVDRAQQPLDVGGADVPVVRRRLGRAQPLIEGRHARLGFERILWGDQPPDLVEAEVFQGFQGDMPVPVMGRIEGPAEQPDAAARRGQPSAQRTGQSRRSRYGWGLRFRAASGHSRGLHTSWR